MERKLSSGNQVVTTSVEIAKKEIDDRIEEILNKLYGVDSNKAFRCVNPQHPDKNASMGLDKTGNKKRAHCFACNCFYSSIDLIQLKYPTLEYRDLIMKGCEILGIPFEMSSSFSSSTGNNNAVKTALSVTLRDDVSLSEYLQKHNDYSDIFAELNQELLKSEKDLKYWCVTRGINIEVLKRYKIGKLSKLLGEKSKTAIEELLKSCHISSHYNYIIPFDNGYCQAMLDEEGRKNTTLGKYCKMKGRKQPLFNYSCLTSKPNDFVKIIFVTEGVLDALSVSSVSNKDVVAVCGVGLNTLTESIRHYCNSPKIVLIDGFDNDEAGNKAGEELKKLCESEKWIYYNKTNYDYKDYNEYLVNDKIGFAEYIEREFQGAVALADNTNLYPVEEEPLKVPTNEKEWQELKNSFNDYPAEKVILSLLIRYEHEALDELTALRVTSELFSSPVNAKIYKALCRNFAVLDCYSPDFMVSFLQINAGFKNRESIEIVHFFEKEVSNLRFKDWKQALRNFVDTLKQQATRRVYTHCAKSILETNQSKKDITEVKVAIREHQDKIEILNSEDNKRFDLDSFLDETVHKTVGNIEGLNTGFKKLDKMVSGLKEGSLFVIAGRPGMGKTAFGACIAENTATYALLGDDIMERGGSVLFISLEMGFEELYTRTLVRDMQQPLEEIRAKIQSGDQEELEAFNKTKNILKQRPMYYEVPTERTVEDLIVLIRKYHREKKIRVAVIDHLHLITSAGLSNRALELAKATALLKAIAIELKITILLLAQLNRGVENREDKRPVMSDLRDSGGVEENADIICFLYRPEYYNRAKKGTDIGECIVAKNRSGECGAISLKFRGECYLYSEAQDWEVQQMEERLNDQKEEKGLWCKSAPEKKKLFF